MPRCEVAGCGNHTAKKGNTASFFRFPRSDPARLKAWVFATGRKDLKPAHVTDDYRICSDHFEEDDFKRDLQAELMGVSGMKRKRGKQLKEGRNPRLPQSHPGALTTSKVNVRETSVRRAEEAARKEV
jgi:hypothetical protein